MEANKTNGGTAIGTEADSYQRLKESGGLPVPSDKSLKIYHLAHDDRTNIAEVAAVVVTDPAISAAIVKMANSVFYESLYPITSVERAIVRLGLKMVKTVSLGCSLICNNKNGHCGEFDYERFWSESLIRAVVAFDIADEYDIGKGILDPDEAFTIGLFCQIGRLAFATSAPDEYAQVLKRVDHDRGEHLREVETETFGLNHNELAAEMMNDWRLPETYSRAVRFQKSPDYERALIAGSAEREISDIIDKQDWYIHMLKWTGTMSAIMLQPEIRLSRAVLDYAVEEAEQLGVSPDGFSQKYDSIVEECKNLGSILEIETQELPGWDETRGQANR